MQNFIFSDELCDCSVFVYRDGRIKMFDTTIHKIALEGDYLTEEQRNSIQTTLGITMGPQCLKRLNYENGKPFPRL